MKRVVLNLCGIKSKGGISIAKNFLKNNKDLDMFILYDNVDLSEIIENKQKELINFPRYLHPFLNLFLSKDTKKIINSSELIIHFGNFGFKTKIKNIIFVQNILPLTSPLSSLRNLILRILYIFSFTISDEIIVQQEHVANLIPKKYSTRVIGSLVNKKVKQNNKGGFVVIIEENHNKNPQFLIKIINQLIELDYRVTVINSSKFSFHKNADIFENPSHNELIDIFKANDTYIHASEYETVGLPIYEALNNGLKVVIPKKDYLSVDSPNIYRYIIGDLDSAIQACLKSADKKSEIEEVPVYIEDWKLT